MISQRLHEWMCCFAGLGSKLKPYPDTLVEADVDLSVMDEKDDVYINHEARIGLLSIEDIFIREK